MHVEAYWHTEASAYNHAYCSLPKFSDIMSAISTNNIEMDMTSDSNVIESGIKDPVAAGDYCEVHGIFACDIPHNDVD